MEKIWKDVVGYKGLYKVSNTGEIKSLARRTSTKIVRKEYTLKQWPDKDGYMRITLCNWKTGNRGKQRSVHRIVAEAFIPNPNNYPIINHKDENKANNNVENLEWCTNQYNLTYGNRLTYISGENNTKHKLTESQVKEIRHLYVLGDKQFGQNALSKKYGVSRTVIRGIVLEKTWKCLLKED